MVSAGDPVTSADGTAVEDYTIRKPLVRLAQQVAQALTIATDVAITFGSGSEEIDTHGFHDETTNNTRITPTLAGYYRIFSTACFATPASGNFQTLSTVITKNGTQIAPLLRLSTGTTAGSRSVQTSALVSANGTTDWFDMRAQHTNTAGLNVNTSVGTPLQSTFECVFERPL